MRMNDKRVGPDRVCCPVCGYEFDEVKDVNVCPTRHYGIQNFTPDELLNTDDDYAWCY
jgi:hypothetical protein